MRDEPRDDADDAGVTRRQLLGAGLGLSGALLLPKALRGASSPVARRVARAASVPPRGHDLGAIEHVVIVIQENRSFDHYFGTYRGVRGFDDRRGPNVFGQTAPGRAQPVFPYHLDAATTQPQCAGSGDVPIHDWGPQHDSWANGRLDAFLQAHDRFDGVAQGPFVMSYFTRRDLPYHFALADAFTICDRYHSSLIGPTNPNRLYAMSGTIDPSGANGGPVLSNPGGAGIVGWPTMPEALEDHGVSWKVYQPPGTSVGPGQESALATISFNVLLYFKQLLADPSSRLYQRAFLPTWPDEYVADVRRSTLPQVSWVLPPLVDSEHPPSAPENGAGFLSQVLTPLMANRELWSKTVVFITYDENGGFFDHVAPPTPPPGTAGEYLSVQPLPASAAGTAGPIGLGFRVPMLVVSPFSRGGYVNSDVFDHTSLLRFLETRFGAPAPNLTAWRRQTVGDLTSTLDVHAASSSVPRLPSAAINSPALQAACPNNQSFDAFFSPPAALTVPAVNRPPRQEPGAARRRRAS